MQKGEELNPKLLLFTVGDQGRRRKKMERRRREKEVEKLGGKGVVKVRR